MIHQDELQQQLGEAFPEAFATSLAAARLEAAHQTALDDDAPTIVEAIDFWSNWYEDKPPVNVTDLPDVDLKLADAFRMLAYLRNRDKQLQYIEQQVHSASDFPAGENVYRTIMITWWMAIFEAGQS